MMVGEIFVQCLEGAYRRLIQEFLVLMSNDQSDLISSVFLPTEVLSLTRHDEPPISMLSLLFLALIEIPLPELPHLLEVVEVAPATKLLALHCG